MIESHEVGKALFPTSFLSSNEALTIRTKNVQNRTQRPHNKQLTFFKQMQNNDVNE